MTGRFFIALGVLLLIVNIVCGGEFQRATDGKTLVWNNDPKPDDAASWSGNQDKEGYATGTGTLTWYRVQRTKLTGSNLPTDKRIPISSYSGKMVHGKLTGAVVAADPSGKFYHGTFVNGRRTGDWTEGAPRIRRGELVEAASPAEGPPRSKEEIAATSKPAAHEKRQQPSVETTPPTSPASESVPPVSDSLRSLTAPPASLRTDAAAAPAAPMPASTAQMAVPPASAGRGAGLNATQAIDLADTEARARGYKLDAYQRPQAQYSAVDDTWSVSYEPKTGTTNPFTITVDREKRAEFKK